jgi:microcystin-dependent protein
VDNTTDREHAAGSVIYPVFTAFEANQANELVAKYQGQGALVYQGASTFQELTVGTAGQVLKVNSGATAPEWGQAATAGIADAAVTSAKIASAALKLLCPVGTIAAYGGVTAPTGWLLCDGSAINASYSELIALVGANAPDMRGRFPIGDNASLTLLGTGGSTTIAEANLPSHTHGMQNHTHSIDHDHAAGGSHSHTISITDPGHRHVYLRPTEGSHLVVNASDASLSFMDSYNTANSDSATTGITATASSSNVDLGNFTGTSGAPSNNTTTATGSGTAYYQPYLAVNYIIKHDY